MTVKSMTPWKMFQRQIITPDKEACEGNVHSAPQSAWGGELGPASLRPCIPLLPLSLGRPESFQICHLRGLLVLPCPVDTQRQKTLLCCALTHWDTGCLVAWWPPWIIRRKSRGIKRTKGSQEGPPCHGYTYLHIHNKVSQGLYMLF